MCSYGCFPAGIVCFPHLSGVFPDSRCRHGPNFCCLVPRDRIPAPLVPPAPGGDLLPPDRADVQLRGHLSAAPQQQEGEGPPGEPHVPLKSERESLIPPVLQNRRRRYIPFGCVFGYVYWLQMHPVKTCIVPLVNSFNGLVQNISFSAKCSQYFCFSFHDALVLCTIGVSVRHRA